MDSRVVGNAVLAALFGLLLTAPSVRASAPLHDQLESALQDAKGKEYGRAIGRARKLLDSLALDTVEDIILAHKILGVSYCETGDQPKATEHFEALVTFSPNETLEGLVRTKPCAELFTKIQLATKPPPTAVETQGPASVPRTQNPAPAASPPPAERSPSGAWRRYVPFGTGQFENGQNGKGWAFLAGETAAVATGLTSFLLYRSEEGANGVFKNPGRASAYRGLYWGSIGVGTALAVWGIVDAVIVFRHQSERRADRMVSFDGTRLALKF